METPGKFTFSKLSIRKTFISIIISTDEDPSLRIESFAINLRGVSTKLYFGIKPASPPNLSSNCVLGTFVWLIKREVYKKTRTPNTMVWVRPCHSFRINTF